MIYIRAYLSTNEKFTASVQLEDGSEVVYSKRMRAPFFEVARMLLETGVDPKTECMCFVGETSTLSYPVYSVDRLAGLDVYESSQAGPYIVEYRPHYRKAEPSRTEGT